MVRAMAFVGALVLVPAAGWAQGPCTTDAGQVVDHVYRQVLERPADQNSSAFVERLQRGNATVRDIVREVARSTEHKQRFLDGTREAAASQLYRHLLNRQPDP